jgi:hypothetical protein
MKFLEEPGRVTLEPAAVPIRAGFRSRFTQYSLFEVLP